MSRITTHILDTVLGKPAAGVMVRLERQEGGEWVTVSSGVTDQEGRCRDLCDEATAGRYRLAFQTGAYFISAGRRSIYPEIAIIFACGEEPHYHLPLLLSENSYTTYRGS